MALESFRQALASYRTLVEKDPRVIDNRRELAITCRELAELSAMSGQTAEAAAFYEEAGRISELLARQNPFLVALQADAAAVYSGRGKLERQAAHLPQALEWFQRAYGIQQQLANSDPDEVRYQNDLAGTLLQIGLVRLAGGELPAARENFDAAMVSLNRLLAAHPQDSAVQIVMAQAHTDLGLVERSEQKPAEALRQFQQAHSVYEKLAADKPASAEFLFGKADALLNIAVEQRSMHQPLDTLKSVAEADTLQVELTRKYPGIPKYENLAGEILYLQGFSKLEQGNLTGAMPFYQRARKIREQLATSQPENWELQSALGTTLDEVAVIHWQLEHYEEASRLFKAATEPLKLAVEHAPAIALYRRNLANHLTNLAIVEREAGRPEAAAKFITQHRALWPDDPAELFKVAVEWSLTAAALEKDAAQLTSEQQSLHRQCQTEALDALKTALAAGFKDLDKLRADPNLANLRDLPGFQKLLESRQTPSSPPDGNGINDRPK